MVALLDIVCRHGVTIEAHHKNSNMSKLALCKPHNYFTSHLI